MVDLPYLQQQVLLPHYFGQPGNLMIPDTARKRHPGEHHKATTFLNILNNYPNTSNTMENMTCYYMLVENDSKFNKLQCSQTYKN